MTVDCVPHRHTALAAYPSGTVYPWDYLLTVLTNGLTGPPIEMHIVRHAQSVANARGLITGQSDADLTLRGYVQAIALGFRMPRHYDVAWVSCLGRARRTLELADILRLRRTGPLPLYTDPRLDERSLGDLEGTPTRPIPAYSLGDLTYAPKRGESYLDLARRLLSFMIDIRRQAQREVRVLVGTHVGPMRLLVGTIERFGDPRSVLALKFTNAQAYSCVLRDLTWPPFISKEVLFERQREMDTASTTSDDS